ncbi:hypothetical protein AX15_002242 [Amanita polypyramis BW_CC]|nr:hypothetical protein AX15_002242 [Amanita polypyramis BW_CC]
MSSVPGSYNIKLEAAETITVTDTTCSQWSRFREIISEPFAEFLGVVILTVIGLGVNCQVVLSSNPLVASTPRGDWATIALGWGSAAALAVWTSGSISGGHINPAVTLTLATFRGFPWKKVPAYILSQLLGAIVGAAIIYANYFHAIDIFEGGRNVRTLKTAGLFAVYPLEYMTNVSAFFSEFLGAAVLMIGILTMCDKKNSGSPNELGPLIIFVTFVAITVSLGMETGFGINPARDLGPRILTSMVGYGRAVYNFRRQYWLWCEVIAPIFGTQAGALAYDVMVYSRRQCVQQPPHFSPKIPPSLLRTNVNSEDAAVNV